MENADPTKTKSIDPASDKKAAGSNSFKDKVKRKLSGKSSDKAGDGNGKEGIIKSKVTVDFEPELMPEFYEGEEDLLEAMEAELSEVPLTEALTTAQRNKRKMIMRRYKSKLKIARKRSMRIRANAATIQKRARRQAIQNMKRKLAGGRNPSSLSVSEKNRVEKMTKKRASAVNRATRKLTRDKKTAERIRLQKRNSPK